MRRIASTAAANTSLTDPKAAGYAQITDAVGNGQRVPLAGVRVKARGTTTAGLVRIFLCDRAGNATLLTEIKVAAITASGTVAAWEDEWEALHDSYLEEGEYLIGTTHNAENFTFIAWLGPPEKS